MSQCDCGAATTGKYADVHAPNCPAIRPEKIKYWWSEDRQWFCLLVNDGNAQATVSLTTEEADALTQEVMQGPEFLELQEHGRQQAMRLLEAARVGKLPKINQLEEALSHLSAAVTQRAASDDKIIADHVEAAFEHVRQALTEERAKRPYWRDYPADQKVLASLAFEKGGLVIKGQGHGPHDGSGYIGFDDDDAEWADDPESRNYRTLKVARSDLIAIRDHINECLGPYSDEPGDTAKQRSL